MEYGNQRELLKMDSVHRSLDYHIQSHLTNEHRTGLKAKQVKGKMNKWTEIKQKNGQETELKWKWTRNWNEIEMEMEMDKEVE